MNFPNKKELREWITWAYSLFLPKIHNRIALTVVICGLAQFLTPVWLPYLEYLLNKYLEIKMSSTPNPIYGVIILAFGLIYHYFSMKLDKGNTDHSRLEAAEKKTKADVHDTNLANHLRKVYPPNYRDSIVYTIENEHVYWNKQSSYLHDLIELIENPDFIFLNELLAEKAKKLSASASKLASFLAYNFWVWPEQQTGEETRFALWPWGNVDRAGPGDSESMKKYAEFEEGMLKHIEEFKNSYDELLESFHRELMTI